ncbi:hypothetical protein [Bradyrhizobium sp. Arg816]|uniref:hypothetical protein n=1 Tax=Bradyrhizobium sp. Arg816 TaxID=2998491 RepID=UPI00249F3D68|nr:hypothetical protein [Bradyrhizobium sp. Arg816]MDI3561166.1 hypothetical protein [Bradyrhizobium sp. Arg816]
MSHHGPWHRQALRAAAMGLFCLTMSVGAAFGADEDEDKSAKPDVPNIYLDLRTTYATIPAGTLGLGFGNTSLSAAFEALVARRGTTLPNGLPAAKFIAVDLPLTVDVSDRVSLYGGVSGSTSTAWMTTTTACSASPRRSPGCRSRPTR